jgi:hypothetical protein
MLARRETAARAEKSIRAHVSRQIIPVIERTYSFRFF